jgi:hypothetical protein
MRNCAAQNHRMVQTRRIQIAHKGGGPAEQALVFDPLDRASDIGIGTGHC